MRKFSSYGPLNKKLHYYAPRKDLIETAYLQLVGEDPEEGGHYITVWAPRQTGKSWTMQQILWRLQKDDRFDVLKLELEKESSQKVEQDVIERLYYETRGQPGLVCWFGELLTEGWDNFVPDKVGPVTIDNFEEAYEAAVSILPSNNILNIISKARVESFRDISALYLTRLFYAI